MRKRIIKQNILITGASGFIGRNLCAFLKEKGYGVRAAVRNSVRDISGVDEYFQIGDIGESTDWLQALAGVDTVIHLAARVHNMGRDTTESLDAFSKVNTFGTQRLAEKAVNAGVKRFIFISSVKVNGERTEVGGREGELKEAFSERDAPDPQDAYGISKREAEDSLASIANEIGLQTVILRLPLVYGPGVKANFKNLIKIASIGLPLPFRGINNQRSFIYLGNLVDAISICITHPKAVGETFMVSDGQDISTSDLIKMIACAMGKKAFLFSLHPGILKALCKIVGKTEALEKLTGSLLVDSSKIRNLLGWKPLFTLEEGIRETVEVRGRRSEIR